MKKGFIFSMLLVVAGGMAAQTTTTTPSRITVVENTDKYKVETNRFWSNWFISVGGGGQVYFGDHDKQLSFGKRISPALDIAVGKWFTPGIGLRIMYSGLSAKGLSQPNNGYEGGGPNSGNPQTAHSSFTNADLYPTDLWGSSNLYHSKFNYMNLHGDVMFNLSNLFCGYKEKRLYNLTLTGGIGWGVAGDNTYGAVKVIGKRDVTANVGLLNSFRLGEALDLNLEAHTMIVKDIFDGEIGGRREEAAAAVTLGLTYKFKKRGWSRSTTTTVSVGEDELASMRDRLRDLGKENSDLRDELIAAKNKKPEVITKNIGVAPKLLVIFPFNEYSLSKEARVNLGFFAEQVKKGDASVVYTITGYADNTTGTASSNQRLSEKRAQAVYDCLINEFGVNASQLKTVAAGGVDNMFYNTPSLSRAAISENK
jgi:outer membrane protein OmpA-like peptidoglycan-associated protein